MEVVSGPVSGTGYNDDRGGQMPRKDEIHIAMLVVDPTLEEIVTWID